MSTPTSEPWRARARAVLQRWRWRVVLAVPLLFAPPILAVNAPQDVRLPPLKERKAPVPALFSHWAHDSQRCYSCHPGVFPQAPLGFTHQDMREGRYCGSCHDGRAAKAPSSMRCEACHVPR
ncbi:c(7)-type cytochrome triheme domain-containing protein [Myxococcus sp. AB025B]|uniref:c(7)-type cytochrome triheme domain-containing protein n=1 Tax=Myxococcus sp. AB025B TaxID=2562794 RepID=UPI00114238F1|nr:c(7)-type cytochrome triheme domain-containing protein [Myxococcus sp. AB025B]